MKGGPDGVARVPSPARGRPGPTLLERLRAGDEAAFGELVRRWSPAVLRLARNFVSTSQSAEDAVQDAWFARLCGATGIRFSRRDDLDAAMTALFAADGPALLCVDQDAELL